MARESRRKVKDLVEMLENPDDSGYVGGDYEDMMEELEKGLSSEEREDGDYRAEEHKGHRVCDGERGDSEEQPNVEPATCRF